MSATAPVAIGLDLSLTATGIAIVSHRPPELGPPEITLHRVVSAGKKDDDLRTRRARLHRLLGSILQIVDDARPDHICIEGPSMASKFGHPHDRSGLWWLVVFDLASTYSVSEIPPSLRMKYATGKGQAQKDAVLTSVVRRYPQVDVQDNNEADAFILAAMASRQLGFPLEASLPQTHTDAMSRVHW